eukprot:GSChrysophyteH1.ASY1.ANO1.3167.1 assembled CDS
MNPGYAGRAELPDNLKALFRPITVMVPDLVLICENMLMAEGFLNGKILASKFYGLYSLLRDLLSKQMHYDWGLRAVKSVLVVAGGFKRAEPDLNEEDLLMRALHSVVFFGLLGDLFPGIDPPRKMNPDEFFRLKVVQLEELLEIRHCVFVMGPPGAGKTQTWRTLAEARTIRGEKTKCVDINPKSVTTQELKPKWIILDGDLDTNWIESMNSVMDDNKMLTLASNEPTVSRAGILYISTDDGTQWRSLIVAWIKSYRTEDGGPVCSDEAREKLQTCFDTYVQP